MRTIADSLSFLPTGERPAELTVAGARFDCFHSTGLSELPRRTLTRQGPVAGARVPHRARDLEKTPAHGLSVYTARSPVLPRGIHVAHRARTVVVEGRARWLLI
jgi:hypothetical protein